MESGQASSWCSIVPEYLLHNIAENEEASSELREAAKNTIEEGRDLLDKSVISNNITGTINGKTISVTFNGKPPPARGVERSVWNANGSYDLPGTACIYHFFQEAFNWKLFDNNGNQLHVTLEYGQQCMNAYWNGSQVILGSGSPRLSDASISFNLASDVLAHELTHGIISQTSGLQYHDEPGALSEHLAGVFGVLYMHYEAEFNGKENQSWIIGESIFEETEHPYKYPIRPAERADGLLLHLERPHSFPPFPRSTNPPQAVRYPRPPRKLAKLKYDNGGVHHYSGIPNLAFYTAAMNAGGVPWRRVGQVWFRAMTDPRLRPDSNFPHFAALTIDWAEKQYPHLKDAIVKGWEKVDVEPLLSTDCAEPSTSTKSVESWKPAETVGPLRVEVNVGYGDMDSD